MNNQIDDIIKEELTKDMVIVQEGDGPGKSKVYPKIAGLNNLGRTYFLNWGEIAQKGSDAQANMAQKYGNEIYGVSGQQAGQRTNFSEGGSGVASGTGSGHGTTQDNDVKAGSGSGLIKCTVNKFMTIPDKGFKNESKGGSGGGFNAFKDALGKLIEAASTGENEEFGKKKQDDIEHLTYDSDTLRGSLGTSDKGNAKACKEINKILDNKDWKANKSLASFIKAVKDGYESWSKGDGEESSGDGNSAQSSGSDWNPNYTFKIDIQTNFGEDWFKRKFKSGLLNAALMAFKTGVSQKNSDTSKHHTYTGNEMLGGDQRKLDSIQWKMTNKVAKDYVKLLLGWSRDKVYYPGHIKASELKEDGGFGKKMASKALDGRGILGRLKQKIFSGGQNSNTISVVFQLADLYDGSWEMIEKKEDSAIKQDQNDGEGDDTKQEQVNESCGNGLIGEYVVEIGEKALTKLFNEAMCQEYPTYENAINSLVDCDLMK